MRGRACLPCAIVCPEVASASPLHVPTLGQPAALLRVLHAMTPACCVDTNGQRPNMFQGDEHQWFPLSPPEQSTRHYPEKSRSRANGRNVRSHFISHQLAWSAKAERGLEPTTRKPR